MSTEHPILAPGVAEGPEFTHVRAMFDDDRATAEIGARITTLDLGKCEGHFTIRPEMCNGHGTAQGGYLYMFADSIFAGCLQLRWRVGRRRAQLNPLHRPRLRRGRR